MIALAGAAAASNSAQFYCTSIFYECEGSARRGINIKSWYSISLRAAHYFYMHRQKHLSHSSTECPITAQSHTLGQQQHFYIEANFANTHPAPALSRINSISYMALFIHAQYLYGKVTRTIDSFSSRFMPGALTFDGGTKYMDQMPHSLAIN